MGEGEEAGDAGTPNLVGLCQSDDPIEALDAVRLLRTLVDRQEFEVVARARQQDWSWNDIAEALGKTKQNVWRKHHFLDGESLDLSSPEPV